MIQVAALPVFASTFTAIGEPNGITFEQTLSSSITASNTTNRYTVIMLLPGTLTVSLTSPGGVGALPNNGADVRWLDSAGTRIGGTTAGFLFPYNHSMELAAGTYFIEVVQRAGAIGTNVGTFNFRAEYVVEEVEPNNTMSTAQDLTPGLRLNASLFPQSDVDMFRYILTEPGRLTVNVTRGTLPTFAADVIWRNSVGEIIRSAEGVGSGMLSRSMDLEAGAYFIEVRGRSGINNTGTYSLFGTFSPSPRNNLEPNNTITTAQALAFGQSITGFFGNRSNAENTDIYRYVLIEPGSLTVNVSRGTLPTFAADVIWRNSVGEIIRSAEGVGSGTLSRSMDLEIGTYFIEIRQRSGSGNTGTYNLRADLLPAGNNETEPNNSLAQAQILSSGQRVTGFLSFQDSVDVFRYDLVTSGRLTVNVSRGTLPTFAADVVWRNSDNEIIRSAEGLGSAALARSMDLEAGVYFIEIRQRSGSNNTGTYHLTIQDSNRPTATTISGVTLTPSAVSVQRGTSRNFTATITGQNITTAQSVNWAIVEHGTANETSTAAGSTISNTGLLTVSENETRSTITVRATSVTNPAISRNAVVTVIQPPRNITVINGTGGGVVNNGASATVRATARTGYAFDGWWEGNRRVSSDLNYTFVATSDRTLFAWFKPIARISLSPTTNTTFTAADIGYGTQPIHTRTINNTGDLPTGQLTVTLAGTSPEAFQINSATGNSVTISSIMAGNNATFTVRPRTGLVAGTYTATVTVSGANVTSASFTVSFTVNPASWGITLSTTTNFAFPAAAVGYSAQAAHSRTVNNTGNQATGQLTIALSGTNPEAFQINSATGNSTTMSSIAVGGVGSFTVRPRTGLVAGTYTATVTVSGTNITSRTFTVSFTVDAATSGISLSPTTAHAFPTVTFGYSAPTANSRTINNTGNQATGQLTVALSGANPEAFQINTATGNSTTVASIAAGGNGSFTVRPRTGLSVGTYTATVTVSGTNVESRTFTVSFTVNRASQSLSANILSRNVGGESINLTGHATSSAGAVANSGEITYAVTTVGGTGAVITGNTLSFTSEGTATITATAAGSENFNSATFTFQLIVTRVSLTGTATITGTNEIGRVQTVNTSSVGGSGAFSYQWTADNITIPGATDSTFTLTGEQAGAIIRCIVTRADNTGSVTAARTTTVPFGIELAITGSTGTDSVTISSATGRVGNTITLTYTLSSGGSANSMLSFVGATGLEPIMTVGSSTINYTVNASDAVDGVITIGATFTHTNLTLRTLDFELENQTVFFGGSPFTNAATRSSGSGTITYESSNTDIATVSSTGRVTIVGVGTTTITARVAANSTYSAATASFTVTVDRATQNAPTGLSALGDNTITGVTSAMEFRLSTDAIYTPVIGTEITGLIAGTYRIRFSATETHAASPDTIVTLVSSITPIIIIRNDENNWFELHNPTDTAISTKGLYLSNDSNDLLLWQMPAIIIRGGDTIRIVGNDYNGDESYLKRCRANFNIGTTTALFISDVDGAIIVQCSLVLAVSTENDVMQFSVSSLREANAEFDRALIVADLDSTLDSNTIQLGAFYARLKEDDFLQVF
jgi:tetrahydromethanopterin S-methyltransferase subunit B